MKLTKQTVKWFEKEQHDHGTKTALYNVLWMVATEMLKDLGITHIETSYPPRQRKQKKQS